MGITYALLGCDVDESDEGLSAHNTPKRKKVRISNTNQSIVIPSIENNTGNGNSRRNESQNLPRESLNNYSPSSFSDFDQVLEPERPTSLRREPSIRSLRATSGFSEPINPSSELPIVFSSDNRDRYTQSRSSIQGILRSSRSSSFTVGNDDNERLGVVASPIQTNINTLTNVVANYDSTLDTDDEAQSNSTNSPHSIANQPNIETAITGAENLINSIETMRNTLHNSNVDPHSQATQILRSRSNSRSRSQTRVHSPPPRTGSPVFFGHENNDSGRVQFVLESGNEEQEQRDDSEQEQNQELVRSRENLQRFATSIQNEDITSRSQLLDSIADVDFQLNTVTDSSQLVLLRILRSLLRICDERLFQNGRELRRVPSHRSMGISRALSRRGTRVNDSSRRSTTDFSRRGTNVNDENEESGITPNFLNFLDARRSTVSSRIHNFAFGGRGVHTIRDTSRETLDLHLESYSSSSSDEDSDVQNRLRRAVEVAALRRAGATVANGTDNSGDNTGESAGDNNANQAIQSVQASRSAASGENQGESSSRRRRLEIEEEPSSKRMKVE